MDPLMDKLQSSILSGEEEETVENVNACINGKIDPKQILEKSMIPAMETIGARFAAGEAFIPELIVAAKAMEAGMKVLKKRMKPDEKNKGLILLGTVEGDIHSIGKNLVKMCLEGAGFEVYDLGENIKTKTFVDAYRRKNPDVLGLSALLSSTMQHMEHIIKEIRAVDSKAKIIVGGAPLTQEFADKIQASGYASNAFEAVGRIKGLLQG